MRSHSTHTNPALRLSNKKRHVNPLRSGALSSLSGVATLAAQAIPAQL
jgi:hypothetical protein